MPLGLLDPLGVVGTDVLAAAAHEGGGSELRGAHRADEASASWALSGDGEALYRSRAPGLLPRLGGGGGRSIRFDRIAVQVADAKRRFLDAEYVGAGDLANHVPRAGGALADTEGRDHRGERQAHRVRAERGVHACPQR